jgi:hypothetical protein
VAGALVSDARQLVFTSNRGEHTVGIFAPDAEETPVKVPVGIGPHGLAHDPGRNLLLAATVGDHEREKLTGNPIEAILIETNQG